MSKRTAAQIQADIAALQAELAKVEENNEVAIKAAHAEIASILKQMDALFARASKLADEYEISFSWDGPGYGSGGWYSSGEWQSSSASC